MIYLFILGIIIGNLEQFEHKHLLSLTLNKSAEKDYLKYTHLELRQIRSRCQKVPQLTMIKISTQMRVYELGIQRRDTEVIMVVLSGKPSYLSTGT